MLIGQFENNQDMSKNELLSKDLYNSFITPHVHCALVAYLTAEYLAHQIQQPNSKLRILNFPEFFSQSNFFGGNTIEQKTYLLKPVQINQRIQIQSLDLVNKPCVLGSSSIWMCRISNICCCPLWAGALEKIKTNVRYSKFDTSK